MSRHRSVDAEVCLACGDPDIYAKGLCRPDYLRRRRGLPDLPEETRVQRNYERWTRQVERERLAQIMFVTVRR